MPESNLPHNTDLLPSLWVNGLEDQNGREMKGGLKWPPKVTCKLCSYSKSYDLLIHQGQIANVHGVIIFQAAKEAKLLKTGSASRWCSCWRGHWNGRLSSQWGWFNIPQCYILTWGGLGPHNTWSVADKTAPGQNFMNKNKTPLIFHGNMLMSTLIIVHINISSSWLRIRLGVVRSWLISWGRMGHGCAL